MPTLYGLRLELSQGGAAYMNVHGTWEASLSYPLVFKKREDAEADAFDRVAKDSALFGRVTVIRLLAGVNQWFLG